MLEEMDNPKISPTSLKVKFSLFICCVFFLVGVVGVFFTPYPLLSAVLIAVSMFGYVIALFADFNSVLDEINRNRGLREYD